MFDLSEVKSRKDVEDPFLWTRLPVNRSWIGPLPFEGEATAMGHFDHEGNNFYVVGPESEITWAARNFLKGEYEQKGRQKVVGGCIIYLNRSSALAQWIDRIWNQIVEMRKGSQKSIGTRRHVAQEKQVKTA